MPNPHELVYKTYIECYRNKFGISPEINFGASGSLIKRNLKNHSIKGLARIVEMYFEQEQTENYNLPAIMSAYSINKYAPKLWLNPMIYADADKHNKEVY